MCPSRRSVIPTQRRSCIRTNIKQPTGGVILLNDTQPDEAKSLIELKVKKATVQPAPGRELGGVTAATPATPQPASQAQQAGALGAILALTAVDDDDDGDEMAPVPDSFDHYESDGEEDE